MLLLMYQIFSSLLGHLPFSMHFFLHFYGVTFSGTPNIFVVLDLSGFHQQSDKPPNGLLFDQCSLFPFTAKSCDKLSNIFVENTFANKVTLCGSVG